MHPSTHGRERQTDNEPDFTRCTHPDRQMERQLLRRTKKLTNHNTATHPPLRFNRPKTSGKRFHITILSYPRGPFRVYAHCCRDNQEDISINRLTRTHTPSAQATRPSTPHLAEAAPGEPPPGAPSAPETATAAARSRTEPTAALASEPSKAPAGCGGGGCGSKGRRGPRSERAEASRLRRHANGGVA